MPRVRTSVARAALSGALLVGLAGFSADAHAAPIRLIATDAKGVTLQVTVGAWTLSAPGPDGRARVKPLDGAHTLGEPGRPMLPAFAATLAIPPDARPSARVLSTEGVQSRDGVKLAIAGKPVFREDSDGRLGLQPAVEPRAAIADGPWPPSTIQLAAPFGFRGRRFVQLEVRPFRYDESSARVTSPLTLTVRVDFNRPGVSPALLSDVAARDPQIDAALQDNVLNWDQGQGWRVAPSLERSRPNRSLLGAGPRGSTAALQFDENQPEVRVKLDETALYKLPFDDLSANGYPDGVAVGDVSVHRHEFLEGATPPYGTVELPCEVEDANGNGVFDSGDAVWVWVRNWAERSQASVIQRFWGDAEVIYVTSKPGGGMRVAQRPGWNNVAGLTPLPSFPWRRHFEKDLAPIMQSIASEVDTNIGVWQWTDASLYYVRPDTIRFETNNLDTTHAASFSVRWVGRRFENHFMWAGIRNGLGQVTTVVDSVFWYGKQPVVQNVTFPGSVLTEGNTNFFRQWGKNASLPPDPNTNYICAAGLDWFELEYWRQYRAIQEYVGFNSADASGDVQMRVDGFTGDSLRVYDVTDPDQPVRVPIDPSHVFNVAGVRSFEMQDVVTPGVRREYVAACQNAGNPLQGPRVPAPSAYGVVTRRNLWSASTGDYLLVVPEAFLSTVGPLTALRAAQGLSVLEAPIENIYDEFNGGRHSGAALQRFTKYAYAKWSSRFLTLVGDGTLDPKLTQPGSGIDWIPVLPTAAPVTTSEGFEVVPSDNRYGFITGNEQPIGNPDTNRVVPELMVGRLTVNSVDEATNMVSKLVNYENVQAGDTWRKNVLLNADDAYSGDVFLGGPVESGYCHRFYEELFVGLNHTMHGFISSDSGVAGMNVEEFNLRYYLPNEQWTLSSVTGDTCRLDRATTQQHCHAGVTPILIGKLNTGQLLWNYQGHANEYVLTHEDMFVNLARGDELRLANDNKSFIFTAFSCHANMFAHPGEQSLVVGQGPCLGEDLVAQPNGRGAVASWASVSFEVVPRDDQNHINVELIRSMFVNPPRDEFLGPDDRGSRVIFGECILSALFRYLGTVQSLESERGLSITYTLLGDPATRVSIGRPIGQLFANQLPVTSGTPVRLHTLGDTLRIDADVVSNVRIDSLALYVNTGSGDVVVPPASYVVTPPLPDTAAGSVFGGRHFKLVYHTQPAAITQDYTIVARDRYGLVQRMDVALQLDAVLRSSGTPINDNDEVPATAALSLLVLSPAPIANPLTDISLKLNGGDITFTAAPAPGDPSGREWILSWTHADYPIDEYTLVMTIQNGGSVTRRFRVTAGASKLALRNLFPFPNPFDNDGTRFSFVLLGTETANLKIHVFSQAGKSIYTGVVKGLSPGYHQVAWDGRDAEGDELANGVYFYRVSVTSASGATTQQLGKVVKLRKPHHEAETPVP